MRRRDLIAGTVAVAAAAPSVALASENESPTDAAPLAVAGVGLPIIAGGRVRNYIFVTLRLHLGRGQTAERVRTKEPYLRDALTRAAYRTPFTVADDWNVIDVAALSASLMRSATTLVGRGAVTRVEVFSQVPRHRTRTPAG
ncbi:MAG: hypothetical protein ACI9YM_002491 [Brevundimonas sp.]|jgi:hypothetical protein|uniref:hypothetical protein n=1 Tax=Brevundimonas sp. TaxID=1871086 RepID=UPI0039E3639B